MLCDCLALPDGCRSDLDLKISGYPTALVSGSYNITDSGNRISGIMDPDGYEQTRIPTGQVREPMYFEAASS